MTTLNILILAVVQGASELLPVSSSAHVIVAAKLMGLDPVRPEMTLLLVMLHTGTMFAVIAYFWSAWKDELRPFEGSPRQDRSQGNSRHRIYGSGGPPPEIPDRTVHSRKPPPTPRWSSSSATWRSSPPRLPRLAFSSSIPGSAEPRGKGPATPRSGSRR